MKNKIIILSILLLFIVSLLLILQLKSKKIDTSPVTNFESSTLNNVLNEFKNYSAKKTNVSNIQWRDNSGWLVGIKNPESIEFTIEQPLVELKIKDSTTNQLLSNLDKYLIDQGFKNNEENNFSTDNPEPWLRYTRGYQNDNELCLVFISQKLFISCMPTKTYTKHFEEQLPILETLGNRDQVIYIREKTENSMIVDFYGKFGGGAYALLTKINNKWNLVYAGQDTPSCKALKKYNFPKEIFSECFDY